METPNSPHFTPLHKGRSFICYRDVNKAIEKHRELYGVRLVLKKAVKLENYCLTVEQMRDLNFRLKYGELEYHCSLDNGRPGRPGNTERCPRLIHLRLSPDARTLVVHETHVHELLPKSPPPQVQTQKSPTSTSLLQMPTPTRQMSESVTITPIVRPQPSASPQMSPPSAAASGHEKITMKIKKSQVSPNEMVVVGSPRDAKEQQELRKSPEKQPMPKAAFIAPKPQERVSTVRVQPKPLQDRALVRMPERGTAAVIKPVEKFIPVRMGPVPLRVGERPIAPKVPIPRLPEKSITAVRLPFTKGVVVSRANPPRAPSVVSSTVSSMVPMQGTVTRSSTGTIPTKKEIKKKRTKQSEAMVDVTQMPNFDTELGLNEKQHLAHGILLRLLRVTSQLPMTEFSHALETLETLTDAFTLRQRVSVSIDHGDNEESQDYYNYDHDDDDEEEEEDDEDEDEDDIDDDDDDDIIEIPVENGYHSENGNGVSSTTDENGLAITQVDGTCDLEVSQGKEEYWKKCVEIGYEGEKNEFCVNFSEGSEKVSLEGILEPHLKRLKAV